MAYEYSVHEIIKDGDGVAAFNAFIKRRTPLKGKGYLKVILVNNPIMGGKRMRTFVNSSKLKKIMELIVEKETSYMPPYPGTPLNIAFRDFKDFYQNIFLTKNNI